MFCLVAFVLAVVGQEFWRGAVGAQDDDRASRWPRALVRLAGRNRRRYGGYLVHAGIAVLFLGVAASSAFLDQRDVRLSPGRDVRRRRLPGDLPRATAELGGDAAGTGAPISFGAVLDVRKGGERFTLRPSRNFYPTQDPSRGTISRFFEGEATSEVDVRWGLRKDFWLAVRPDLAALEEPIAEADAKFADAAGRRPGAGHRRARRALPQRPAAGRVPGDRLAARVLDLDRRRRSRCSGALVALWPSPEARLRRVRAPLLGPAGPASSRGREA